MSIDRLANQSSASAVVNSRSVNYNLITYYNYFLRHFAGYKEEFGGLKYILSRCRGSIRMKKLTKPANQNWKTFNCSRHFLAGWQHFKLRFTKWRFQHYLQITFEIYKGKTYQGSRFLWILLSEHFLQKKNLPRVFGHCVWYSSAFAYSRKTFSLNIFSQNISRVGWTPGAQCRLEFRRENLKALRKFAHSHHYVPYRSHTW